jgi:hypothetical protein
MKPMKKLGLINYEGDCLRAIKKGDKIIIKDQHGKELETTNVRGLLEFLDGYRDITDSEGKLWVYREEHQDAKPKLSKIYDFLISFPKDSLEDNNPLF